MKRTLGFSLVELLVVLAVVAFLAFVTVPLASGWIRNAQLEKDFAGLQRALGNAKALAMRNATGSAAPENIPPNSPFASDNIAAVLCRKGDNLFLATAADLPAANRSCADANWNNINAGARPFYRMGQDVAISFGNQIAFCGAYFDARGRVRLCQGNPCTTCTTAFDPATGLSVVVAGADTTQDPNNANRPDPNDQSNTIRAF